MAVVPFRRRTLPDSARSGLECAPGTTLDTLLRERAGALSATFLHEVFGQLGRAVDAFHRVSVKHRDLSPTNVMIAEDDDGGVVVEVLDFGRGSIVGAARYMAPEQVVGAASSASDLYAVGAILWWALTGTEFHPDGLTLHDVMEARLMGVPRADIRAEAPGVPSDVAELVADLLAFDPLERPSAQEFCSRWSALPWFAERPEHAQTLPPALQGRGDLVCVVFDADPGRAERLQAYVQGQGCRVHRARSLESLSVLSRSPDVVFISARFPGAAKGPVIRLVQADHPGMRVVALVSTERERGDTIRAGADLALRVPSELPELQALFEALRDPQGSHGATTLPEAHESHSTRVERFVGEGAELLADIGDAIGRRDLDSVWAASDRLSQQALALGATQLGRSAAACAAFADDGDDDAAAGALAALEREFGAVVQRLFAVSAGPNHEKTALRESAALGGAEGRN